MIYPSYSARKYTLAAAPLVSKITACEADSQQDYELKRDDYGNSNRQINDALLMDASYAGIPPSSNIKCLKTERVSVLQFSAYWSRLHSLLPMHIGNPEPAADRRSSRMPAPDNWSPPCSSSNANCANSGSLPRSYLAIPSIPPGVLMLTAI